MFATDVTKYLVNGLSRFCLWIAGDGTDERVGSLVRSAWRFTFPEIVGRVRLLKLDSVGRAQCAESILPPAYERFLVAVKLQMEC